MRILHFFIVSLLLCGNSLLSIAQDIHFSQYFSAPLSVNPSLTGMVNGDYRAATIFKDQWRSISNPYQTIFASYDMNFLDETMGGGISFYSDKSGASKMGVTHVSGLYAYRINTDAQSYLSFGIQGSYVQESADLTSLKWDSQFDGFQYNPDLPSGEQLGVKKFSYFDFSAGMNYLYYSDYDDLKFNVGLSASHLTQPKQTLLNLGQNDKLHMKFLLHGSLSYPIPGKEFIYLIPKIIGAWQGGALELYGGAMVKMFVGMDSKYTNSHTSSAISGGFFYRHFDAVVASVAYHHKNQIAAGISYDVNISKLRVATNIRGGVEVFIVWQGLLSNDKIKVK